jgi:hypothetical protein
LIGKCAFQNISIHKLIPKRELKNRSLKSQISMGSSLTPLGEKWSLAVEYANPTFKFWIVLIYLTCPVQIQASIATGYFQRMKLVGLLFSKFKIYIDALDHSICIWRRDFEKEEFGDFCLTTFYRDVCPWGTNIFLIIFFSFFFLKFAQEMNISRFFVLNNINF